MHDWPTHLFCARATFIDMDGHMGEREGGRQTEVCVSGF